MPEFPIDWYVVDEDRGWIVCQVENRMQDPGDGTIHQGANITILHYAGDGKWSYEEDVYNPAHFATMVKGWLAAKDAVRGRLAPVIDARLHCAALLTFASSTGTLP